MSKTMTYGEAIREAMSVRMREDPNVILFGEDVGAFGGCFGVSAGMFNEFGPERVRDTPISEGAIIGSAVGSAATGLRRPVSANRRWRAPGCAGRSGRRRRYGCARRRA